MRDPANMADIASVQPQYMGFIFYPKSPRFVGQDFDFQADFPTNIIRVGVFVNEPTDNILRLAEHYNFSFLQLHGEETVQQCDELKNHNFQIIKAFSVDDSFDFASAKFYSAAVDFFLFDTKGKYHGGNARTFNWNILQQYDQHKPFFLSGGLNPENLSDIDGLIDMNLHAVDVNSGVEVGPGLKDLEKVRRVKNILDDLNNRL